MGLAKMQLIGRQFDGGHLIPQHVHIHGRRPRRAADRGIPVLDIETVADQGTGLPSTFDIIGMQPLLLGIARTPELFGGLHARGPGQITGIFIANILTKRRIGRPHGGALMGAITAGNTPVIVIGGVQAIG